MKFEGLAKAFYYIHKYNYMMFNKNKELSLAVCQSCH